MIINIRGTSGSGKSTLVRKVMEQFSTVLPSRVIGRRQPQGYHCGPSGGARLFVPGHYETACGGCDTLPAIDLTFNIIANQAEVYDILFEGIMVSGEWKYTTALHTKFPGRLHVIVLDTPLDECIKSLLDRRAARGDVRTFDSTRTIRRKSEVDRMAERLKLQHIPVEYLSREAALLQVLSLLGVGNEVAGGAQGSVTGHT